MIPKTRKRPKMIRRKTKNPNRKRRRMKKSSNGGAVKTNDFISNRRRNYESR